VPEGVEGFPLVGMGCLVVGTGVVLLLVGTGVVLLVWRVVILLVVSTGVVLLVVTGLVDGRVVVGGWVEVRFPRGVLHLFSGCLHTDLRAEDRGSVSQWTVLPPWKVLSRFTPLSLCVLFSILEPR